jgi:uncharacterized protein (TIGR03086 family)
VTTTPSASGTAAATDRLKDLFARATAGFGSAVHAIGEGDWHLPTPCSEWDVRVLLEHVVGEHRWVVPLLAGRTIADVGDELSGDLLGADPVRAHDDAAAQATAAVAGADLAAVTHLSFGDVPAEEYIRQLLADLLIHGWDLSRALGLDERLDPEVVTEVAGWFTEREDLYRQAGAIGPRPSGDVADGQDGLLVAFGRNPSDDDTLSVLRRFNEAFGRRDVDAVMALMTDDVVFEDTSPPDGRRHAGQAAVRAFWEEFFGSSPRTDFVTEEGVIAGDRGTYRWRFDWDGGHVRGVDVFRVRDGKVAEKLVYVKG